MWRLSLLVVLLPSLTASTIGSFYSVPSMISQSSSEWYGQFDGRFLITCSHCSPCVDCPVFTGFDTDVYRSTDSMLVDWVTFSDSSVLATHTETIVELSSCHQTGDVLRRLELQVLEIFAISVFFSAIPVSQASSSCKSASFFCLASSSSFSRQVCSSSYSLKTQFWAFSSKCRSRHALAT